MCENDGCVVNKRTNNSCTNRGEIRGMLTGHALTFIEHPFNAYVSSPDS